MSVWNSWSAEDQAWALGLDLLERAREAEKCPVCGGPRWECADRSRQHDWLVDGGWCYRTKAQLEFSEQKMAGPKARIAAGASVIRAYHTRRDGDR